MKNLRVSLRIQQEGGEDTGVLISMHLESLRTLRLRPEDSEFEASLCYRESQPKAVWA